MVTDLARLVLFPALMAFAASTDLFAMTISNRVTATLALGFFVAAGADGLSAAAIGSHVAAGVAVLAAGFVCFSRHWIGGGDAKLAAATALWFGWPHLYDYLLGASIIGGALTLLLLEFRRHPLPMVMSRWAWVVRLHEPDAGIPYGIALAVAALLVYPSTAWMTPAGL